MEASTERRRRYVRQEIARSPALTPAKLELLRYVAELGVASLPQLASLGCPSAKSARRHMRTLFDLGIVRVIPVPRICLADPSAANDASLLYGSAPNIFSLTPAGARLLGKLGYPTEERNPSYGPLNGYFLAHTLAIGDVFVGLTLAARAHLGHCVEAWHQGAVAEIPLAGSGSARAVRPDAWFVYRMGESVLVGLVEVDRATERGPKRWREKLAAYQALFTSSRLREVTGYSRARVLVTVPNSRRRDHLTRLIEEESSAELAARFWLAEASVLLRADLTAASWRNPGSEGFRPLVSADLAVPTTEKGGAA